MVRRVIFGFLMSGALVGSALAQSAGGDYEHLSAPNKRIADALYSAQQPVEGAPALTRDEVASLHAEDGWGAVIKDLKDSGYYPDAKSLGQVVGSARRQDSPDDSAVAPDSDRRIRARAGDVRSQAVAEADQATRRAATRAKLLRARRVAQRNVVRRQQARQIRRRRR